MLLTPAAALDAAMLDPRSATIAACSEAAGRRATSEVTAQTAQTIAGAAATRRKPSATIASGARCDVSVTASSAGTTTPSYERRPREERILHPHEPRRCPF